MVDAGGSNLLQELIECPQQCSKQDTAILKLLFWLPAAKGIPGHVTNANMRTATQQQHGAKSV